jgi:hypothetical protein
MISLPSSMTTLYFSNNMIDDVSMTSYMPLLTDCDGANNPIECPMTSQVASQCDTSCTVRDKTPASFRVRVAGDMKDYEQTWFSEQLAETMNVTSDRINVSLHHFLCISHFFIFGKTAIKKAYFFTHLPENQSDLRKISCGRAACITLQLTSVCKCS